MPCPLSDLKALAAEVKTHCNVEVKTVARAKPAIIEGLLNALKGADLSEFSDEAKATVKLISSADAAPAEGKAKPKAEPKGDKKIEIDTLESCCKELNKILGFDGKSDDNMPIETKDRTAEELTAEIVAVADQLDIKDKASVVLKGTLARMNIGPWKDEQDSKPKGTGTASKGTTKKTGEKKPKGTGVIATIRAYVDSHGKKGFDKAMILEHLCKAFPDRDPDALKGTVGVQIPSRINKEHKPLTKKDGKYYLA